MSSEQVPNVFAGLILVKGQDDLFEEIEVEAKDIFGGYALEDSSQNPDGIKTVLLDSPKFRIALAWAAFPHGDTLSLAIGAHQSGELSRDDVQEATRMMSALFRRAKALFEVQRSVWQISILPLTAATMHAHAQSLGSQDVRSGDVHFLSFEPNRSRDTAEVEPSLTSDELLRNMRKAIEAENAKPSLAMQVSALTISTAFVFVTPPVGIAMLTYAALRQGSDMKLFSRNADDDQRQA